MYPKFLIAYLPEHQRKEANDTWRSNEHKFDDSFAFMFGIYQLLSKYSSASCLSWAFDLFVDSLWTVMPLLVGVLHVFFHACLPCAKFVQLVLACSSVSSLHFYLGLHFVWSPFLGLHSLAFLAHMLLLIPPTGPCCSASFWQCLSQAVKLFLESFALCSRFWERHFCITR